MTIVSSPDRNWLAEIHPTVREAQPSGIVEVFDYGRGRQGLIPLWVGEGDLPPPASVSEAVKASLVGQISSARSKRRARGPSPSRSAG